MQRPTSADQIRLPNRALPLPPIGMAADPLRLAVQRRFGLLAVQARSPGWGAILFDRRLEFGEREERGSHVRASPFDPNRGKLPAAGLFVGGRAELCV